MWLIIFLFSILFIYFLFPFLLYYIGKRLGYKKIGVRLGAGWFTLVLILTLFCLTSLLSPHLFFTKKRAKKLLAEYDILLLNSFSVEHIESGGLMDYYEFFDLKISDEDEFRLIRGEIYEDVIIIYESDETERVSMSIEILPEENLLRYRHISP